ncbi:hypothetical protein [Roseobacter sp.]|uniref:hypothetical protein n=1 Tax=Roseobacter sp. TaxID=1907202 RepID=UPI0038583DB1
MKLLTTLFLIFLGTIVAATELPQPQGDVILTVTGNISITNGNGEAQFDRAMIEALEHRETQTNTPWYDDSHTFSGPLGQAILEAVGAAGQTLRVVALNDYSADLPISDLETHPVILATHLDQEQLGIREKGPFFLIYPFDENPELFNEVYFGRSVWQITRIEVRD